jgi:NAD(P)-dependent dehydrogenase (short-subunit alcohol dehydrogenase family)
VAALLAAMALVWSMPQPTAAAEQKAVLVTGASTGIGRNMAETLAKEGFFVYAGARKDQDLDELDAIDNIKAVRLDVTNQDQVDAALEFVKSEGRGLYGLVNNAGVASFGLMTEVEVSELEWVFDVNVSGVVRVTRAFAPLVMESQGRIATTGSIAGIRTSPAMGVYSMSKHAIEAFTDALAFELRETGVRVAIIEPGGYRTAIRHTTANRLMKNYEVDGKQPPQWQVNILDSMLKEESSMKEPDEVSAALLHFLSSDAPLRRYMVVPVEQQGRATITALISELAQLNKWGPYSYSRDELVEMLDQALAE